MTLSHGNAESSLVQRKIRKPLLIGYCHNAFSEKIETAVENGVNVLIWSFIHMELDQTTEKPVIVTDLKMDRIKQLRHKYEHKNLIHMAAFGGWNGPHPPSGVSGKDWCRAFVDFNKKHDNIFDGIDWDLEGHDDRISAPTRRFTMEVLDVMAEFSREAKETHNLLVSLAPAESYLDPLLEAFETEGNNGICNDEHETGSFSLNLNIFPPAWNQNENDRKFILDTGFSHAGKQCYAYVLHKAGIDTFDWISFQYYESYSRFQFDITRRKPPMSQVDALILRANRLQSGFEVDIPSVGKVNITVPLEKIVFGFANGWADGIKVLQVDTQSVKHALDGLLTNKEKKNVGGVMFWTIEEEGNNGIFLSSFLDNAIGSSRNHDEKV